MRAILLAFVVFLAGCVVERCEWTPESDATEDVDDDAGTAGTE